MLEFESTKLDVKFNGKVYPLRFPVVKELKEMGDAGEANSIEAIMKMLKSVGLPQKVCEELELDHMKILVKELTEAKK